MERDGAAYFVNDDGLSLYGENIARALRVKGTVSGKAASREIADDLRTLKRRRDELDARYAGKGAVPTAVEWLLDNFYLAQREGLRAAAQLRTAGRFHAADGIPAAESAS